MIYADAHSKSEMDLKIMAIVRAAEVSGCEVAILSAFGCGAFGNPPEQVAQMFHTHLAKSALKHVVFAIVDDHNSYRHHNENGNFLPFFYEFCGSSVGRQT